MSQDCTAHISLPREAKVVVVGSGIAGLSVTFHLAQRGWKDIVVVDQGPLWETGGSTSHAPGGISSFDARSRTVTGFAHTSARLYSSLGVMHGVGSISIARTPTRMEALRDEKAQCEQFGMSGLRLITPAQVKQLFPVIDPTSIQGGLYFPPDTKPIAPGRISAIRALEKMASVCFEKGAASFHPYTKVHRILLNADASIRGIDTSRGSISTSILVIAGGVWGPLLLRTIGVDLPIMNVQHQWCLTEPLNTTHCPEITAFSWPIDSHSTSGAGHQNLPTSWPCIWDADNAVYFSQMGPCLGIGNYNHKALVVPSENVPFEWSEENDDAWGGPGRRSPAQFAFTPPQLERAWLQLQKLMPRALGSPGAEMKPKVRKAFNGLMSYAPDGFPILGPVKKHPGLWVIECTYVWHAGGAGSLVADWMVDGVPTKDIDVREVDVGRFLGANGRVWETDELKRAVAAVYESRMSDHREEQKAKL